MTASGFGKARKAMRETVKKKQKAGVGLFVAVVVLVGAGAGFWVWHEQPSFCSAVCHDTMGSYVESYESSDYLVNQHAQAGVVCLDCHEAEIATQIAELQVQLSGSYRLPLAKMKVDDEFCLRDGCHTREGIVAGTVNFIAEDGTAVNPHEITFSTNYSASESPHEVAGESIACATCHTAHRSSAEMSYCYDSCHHTETFKSCYDCHDHR